MNSECCEKSANDVNDSQDEEQGDEKLTPEMLTCPAFQQQIRDIVFTLIPEVTRLRDLYLSWESLTKEDKVVVEEYGKHTEAGMELYKPLIDALRQWDRIQETQGAPGCEPGIVTLSGYPQIEALICNVIYALECLMRKLQDSDNSDSLISLHPARLTASLRSVYEEEKDRGDGSVELIYQASSARRSLSLNDIYKVATKTDSILSL